MDLNIFAKHYPQMEEYIDIPKGSPPTQIFADLNELFKYYAQRGKYIYGFSVINEDKKDNGIIIYCFKFVSCDDAEEMKPFINERINICNRIVFDIFDDQG